MGPSISEYVKRCAVQKCTGIQQPAGYRECMTMCTYTYNVIPCVHGTHTHTQEHFYCVFKNNEDYIFLQHYFWYMYTPGTGTTLLLIETRSLAVHVMTS